MTEDQEIILNRIRRNLSIKPNPIYVATNKERTSFFSVGYGGLGTTIIYKIPPHFDIKTMIDSGMLVVKEPGHLYLEHPKEYLYNVYPRGYQ